MDLTTLASVKLEARVSKNTDDTLLAMLITRASDAIGKYCAKSVSSDSGYFKEETVTGEILSTPAVGRDAGGTIKCWPHKSRIISVSSFEYRVTPIGDWIEVDIARVTPASDMCVWAVATGAPKTQLMQARLSYVGGSGSAAADLPGDLQEAATVLTVRYYREAESGLSDAIGLAEVGSIIYSKAMPARVVQMLMPYIRPVPW